MTAFPAILLLAVATTAMAAEKPFREAGGLVAIEAESATPKPGWTGSAEGVGHTGSGFIEWKAGDASKRTAGAGQGVLTFPVAIVTGGRYRLQIRSRPAERTEHNDVWVRIRGAIKVEAVRADGSDVRDLGEAWTKSYNNAAGTWSWNTHTVDHDPHAFFIEAKAGTVILVELSGRSTRFQIDRLVLYTDAHPSATATGEGLPESAR